MKYLLILMTIGSFIWWITTYNGSTLGKSLTKSLTEFKENIR